MLHRFESEVWRWQARADDWYFVTVPVAVGEQVAALPLPPRGFGSVPVAVRVGGTRWCTSIFPNDDGTWALPLKRAVRVAEGIEPGDLVRVELGPVG